MPPQLGQDTDEVLNYALFEASKQLQKLGKWPEVARMFEDFVKVLVGGAPVGASTRRNSASIASCSSRCSMVSNDTIRSILSVASGSAVHEACRYRRFGRAA